MNERYVHLYTIFFLSLSTKVWKLVTLFWSLVKHDQNKEEQAPTYVELKQIGVSFIILFYIFNHPSQ